MTVVLAKYIQEHIKGNGAAVPIAIPTMELIKQVAGSVIILIPVNYPKSKKTHSEGFTKLKI